MSGCARQAVVTEDQTEVAQDRYATGSIGWPCADGFALSDRVLAAAREIVVPLTAGVLSGAGGEQ